MKRPAGRTYESGLSWNSGNCSSSSTSSVLLPSMSTFANRSNNFSISFLLKQDGSDLYERAQEGGSDLYGSVAVICMGGWQ